MAFPEELIDSLVSRSGRTREEIVSRIEEKQAELPGVSEHGIISLVSRDLNINPMRPEAHELKIGNVVPNMFNISFIGKITQVSPLREFEREGNKGKVQNYVIEDETGKIRLSLWNEEIDKHKLELGDIIKAERCRTRKDNFGNAEARVSYGGNIARTEADINVRVREAKTSLREVEENDIVQTEATLLHVFERPMIYYFCPVCRLKVNNGICATHGVVQATKTLIVSGLIDDGNTTINAAFFGPQAEVLLGAATDEAEAALSEKTAADFIQSLDVVTKKFKINGSIRRNQFTNDLELRVSSVEKI